jgi:hypothetical protein
MPILFASTRGRVVRLEDSAAQANIQFLGMVDSRITFDSQLAIVTRMTMSHQVNAQFLHTIGNHVYIYVFGDRIGSMGLSGLAFHGVCDKPGSGAEKMLRWYQTNRASKRRNPLTITIGTGGDTTPIEGFVVGFTQDVVDPSIGLVQWNANLVTLPAEL